jgi:hypothetical protein
MMMRDQYVSQARQRHTHGDKLPSYAITTIDEVGGIIDEDDLGGCDSVRAGSRSAPSAEQNQASSSGLWPAGEPEPGKPSQHRCACSSEFSPIHREHPRPWWVSNEVRKRRAA